MRIDELKVKNFRQHADLDVSFVNEGKNIVVIRGLNGTGKTNLLKAMTWGLTGALGPREPNFLPSSLVSFSALSRAKEGETLEVAVEFGLSLALNGKARVRRSISLTKKEDRLLPGPFKLSVLVEEKGKGWQEERDPELWLDFHLPQRFSHYFLFDGEQLENFFRASESRFIQNAVLEIAQIDHLDRLTSRLETVRSDLTKKVASHANVAGERDLSLEFERIEAQIGTYSGEVEALEKSLDETDRALADARARFGEVKEAQGEIRRRTDLEAAVERAEARMDGAKTTYFKWAVRFGPLLLAGKATDLLQSDIDNAREKNELPPPYDVAALKGLLEEGACVCGNHLGEGSDARKHIEHLIDDFQALSAKGALLNESVPSLSRLSARKDEAIRGLEAVRTDLKESTQEYGELSKALEGLRKKMSGHEDQAVAVISQAYDSAQAAVTKTASRLAVAKSHLENVQSEKTQLQKLIESQSSKDDKAAVDRKTLHFSTAVQLAASKMLTDLETQVRQTVGEKLNSQFQSMIWKKDAFEPVAIDEGYMVRVVNKQGFENREGLSAGETACLAFAFSLTLSSVSGASYPMIVDSPLGRLSGDVKESVSRVLVESLDPTDGGEPRQLVMLMTDEEFDDGVEQILAQESPAVFEIHFDQETSDASLRRH